MKIYINYNKRKQVKMILSKEFSVQYSSDGSYIILKRNNLQELIFRESEFTFYQHLFKICDYMNEMNLCTIRSNTLVLSLLRRSKLHWDQIQSILQLAIHVQINDQTFKLNFYQWLYLCKCIAYLQIQGQENRLFSKEDIKRVDDLSVEIPIANFYLDQRLNVKTTTTSIFEDRMMTLDDSYKCNVKGFKIFQNDNDSLNHKHVKYTINTQISSRLPFSTNNSPRSSSVLTTVDIVRRYRDFELLVSWIRCQYSGVILPPLPPKSSWQLLTSMKSINEVATERRHDLQMFLNHMLSCESIKDCFFLKAFLQTSSNGFRSFRELYKRCQSGTSVSVSSTHIISDYDIAKSPLDSPLIDSNKSLSSNGIIILNDTNTSPINSPDGFNSNFHLLSSYLTSAVENSKATLTNVSQNLMNTSTTVLSGLISSVRTTSNILSTTQTDSNNNNPNVNTLKLEDKEELTESCKIKLKNLMRNIGSIISIQTKHDRLLSLEKKRLKELSKIGYYLNHMIEYSAETSTTDRIIHGICKSIELIDSQSSLFITNEIALLRPYQYLSTYTGSIQITIQTYEQYERRLIQYITKQQEIKKEYSSLQFQFEQSPGLVSIESMSPVFNLEEDEKHPHEDSDNHFQDKDAYESIIASISDIDVDCDQLLLQKIDRTKQELFESQEVVRQYQQDINDMEIMALDGIRHTRDIISHDITVSIY